jgi:RHS repeat-associated protein
MGSGSRSVFVAAVTSAVVTVAPAVAGAAPEDAKYLGAQQRFTLVRQQLADRASFGVNVANGNLVVSAGDIRIAGRGLGLSLTRVYNSRAGGSLRASGRDWLLAYGADNILRSESDGDRTWRGATGEEYRFDRRADGTFAQPPGVNAALVVNADGTARITENRTGSRFDFDAASPGKLVKISDRNQNAITFAYSAGRVSSVSDTQGRVLTFTYDTPGDLRTVADPTGRQWRYGYDANHRLTSYTDPVNGVWQYRYDTAGRLDRITTPRNFATTFAYDSSDRVISVRRAVDTNAANDVSIGFAYSSPTSPCTATQQLKTVVTDGRGKTTTYCSDADRQVSKAVDALGHMTDTQFTPNGDVSRLTSAPGGTGTPAVTSLTFDEAGSDPSHNLTAGSFGAGETMQVDYWSASATDPLQRYRARRLVDAQGSDEFYGYDARGNLTDVKDSDSSPRNRATLTYNSDGTLATATDGEGHQTTFEYFANGDLKRIVPPLPLGAISFTYDALGRVVSATDGSGRTRSFAYDANDRLNWENTPDGSWFAFQYDADGNVIVRSSSGASATYDYDGMGRRTAEQFTGGASWLNSYGYDKASNLVALATTTGTVTYGYDDINRVTSIVSPKPGSGTDTVTYSYNDTANPRTRTATLPGGITQRVDRDLSGKITAVVVKNPAATVLLSRSYSYLESTAQRRLVQTVTTEAGRKTAYTYKDAIEDTGRLLKARTTNASGGLVEEFAYTHDKAGNRTRVVRTTPSGATTTTYAYNAANEMCWRVSGAASNGCAAPPAGATVYTYNGAGERLAGDTVLTWDGRGRLATVAGGDLQYFTMTNDELVAAGGFSTVFYNTLLGLSAIDFQNGSPVTSIVRDPLSGRAVSQMNGTQKRWFVQDHLGSTLALFDTTGSGRSYSYDPDGNDTASGTGADTPVRFAGGHLLGSGLYHFGARYYDTRTARWTQPDPINQPADLREANRYIYAGGDPVNAADPSGKGGCWIGAGAGAGLEYSENTDGSEAGVSATGGVGAKYGFSGGCFTGEKDPGHNLTAGFRVCGGICIGLNSDTGFQLGAGAELDVGLDFDLRPLFD